MTYDPAEEIVEMLKDEYTAEELAEVVCINPDLGDVEKFDSIDEMRNEINNICDNAWNCEHIDLVEGRDFIYLWKQRACEALCDGEALTNLGLTDDDQEDIERACEILGF